MIQLRSDLLVRLVFRFAISGVLAFFLSASLAIGVENAELTNGIVKPIGVDVVPQGIPRSWDNNELYSDRHRVTTAPLEVNRLLAEDQIRKQGPIRTGVVQEFAQVSTVDQGNWSELNDGGWLWTMTFLASGAKSVRIHIDPFNPPPGAELYIFAPGDPDSVRGPITSAYQPVAELWTPTIYGSEEIRLEYYLPPEVDIDDPDVHISVDSVLNNYRTFDGLQEGPTEGGPLPCHLDVRCFTPWVPTASGVGPISFVSNQFGFFCSGAMLGRIGDDFTPLVMTAFHCGVNGGNASSVLITWFFITDSCNGNVPNLNTLPQTQGIVLLKNNNANDFTLIGMSKANTGGIRFQGWTSATWDTGSSAVAIHHPRGSWQRIAIGTALGLNSSCISGADSGWWVVFPNGNGLTEPGSSGSPVFDSNMRVRGTLSCGLFACNQSNSTTWGRFDEAYPTLRPWLNPTDPIFLDAGYIGSEVGTVFQPFNSVLEGTYAVLAGSTIHMSPGTYDGPGLLIDKAVTIRSIGGTATIR